MMLLTIDVGNTNIVLNVMYGDTIRYHVRMETDRAADASIYTQRVKAALEPAGCLGDLDGAILSSVVPEVNNALCAAAEALTGKSCLVLDHTTETGMPLHVDEPATIGADIIAGCAAAKERYSLPLVVVDLGTANTIMAVDRDGAYCGGIISAGLKMQLKALGAGTSLLPDLEIAAPEKCIGTNTVDCLESGAVYGTAAMIDGIVERMEQELGAPLTVVATGGLSTLVCPHCRHKVYYEPELIPVGLADIYRKNVKA